MDSYFAKQPILDIYGDTYGYALLYRNKATAGSYEGTDGDKSTADVINSVFFGGMDNCFLDNKRAFLKFTENLLLEKTALLLPKDRIVIEICGKINLTNEIIDCCRELKKKGYIIALGDNIYNANERELIECANIVKINIRKDRSEIETIAAQCRRLKKVILAEKIETVEEADYAKKIGCTLMQGFFFAQPIIVSGNAYNPMVITFSRLINCLWEVKVNIDDLTQIVSEDPFMTAKLLRLVNSVRSDMSEHISSIKQAILLLGVNKLKDWIYLVGLQSLSQNGPDERVKVALLRAVFCKRIAGEISVDTSFDNLSFGEEMYLIGLMSVVVGSDDYEAMKDMNLSKNISDGLAGKSGIYGDTFKLVVNYEQGNWAEVDKYASENFLTEATIMRVYSESARRVEDMFDTILNLK